MAGSFVRNVLVFLWILRATWTLGAHGNDIHKGENPGDRVRDTSLRGAVLSTVNSSRQNETAAPFKVERRVTERSGLIRTPLPLRGSCPAPHTLIDLLMSLIGRLVGEA